MNGEPPRTDIQQYGIAYLFPTTRTAAVAVFDKQVARTHLAFRDSPTTTQVL